MLKAVKDIGKLILFVGVLVAAYLAINPGF